MEELIIRSKNGDEKSFTELILSMKNDLYKISKTRLNDENDINDAIQETMINAYKHLKKLKDNGFWIANNNNHIFIYYIINSKINILP